MNNERILNRREVLKEQGKNMMGAGLMLLGSAVIVEGDLNTIHRVKRGVSEMLSRDCQKSDPLECVQEENRPNIGDVGLIFWVAGSIDMIRQGRRMIKEAESSDIADAPLEGEQAESLQAFTERVTEQSPVSVKARTVTFSTDTGEDKSWHFGVDLSAVYEDHTHSQLRMAVAPLNPNWNPQTEVARRRDLLMHVMTADRVLQRFRDMEGVSVTLEGPDGAIPEDEMVSLREEAASRSIEPFWVEEIEASN